MGAPVSEWPLASSSPESSFGRFNPADERTIQDPYPSYAWYREHDPVHWGEPQAPGRAGCWYLFRYQDAMEMLQDRRFRRGRSRDSEVEAQMVAEAHRPFVEIADQILLSLDPPDHTRLRGMLRGFFTRRECDRRRAFIRDVADGLIDEFGRSPEVDLVRDFASRLSLAVVGDLLEIPNSDLTSVGTWATRFSTAIDLRAGQDNFADASAAAVAMSTYFRDLAMERRRQPGGRVLTELLQRRDEARLSDDELVAICIQIVFAGYQSAANQIGNSVYTLLREKSRYKHLSENPHRLQNFVTELLRLESAVQTPAARKPDQDVTIGGQVIRAGESVVAMIGSANRDERVFHHSDRFDSSRTGGAPISFGAGIHRCLGASLARLEVEEALSALISRLPQLDLRHTQNVEWTNNLVMRGLAQLRVRPQ